MSNNRGGFGVPTSGRGSSFRAHAPFPYERISMPPAMTNAYNPIRTNLNQNNRASQAVITDTAAATTATAQASSGVVRHRGNRSQSSQSRGGGRSGNNNRYHQQSDSDSNGRRSSLRPDSASFVPAAENMPTKKSSAPHISYSMLLRLLNQEPDEILGTMLGPNFQLSQFLNDKRMETRTDWVPTMTALLEKVTDCKGSRERIVMILEQLPGTVYLEGVYNEVRKLDAVTDQLRFPFIKSFLKICYVFLSTIPHSADGLTKIFERIELLFTKIQIKSSEYEETKLILDEVLERVSEIERRSQKQQKSLKTQNPTTNTPTTTTNNNIQQDIEPPPDDYRLLPIVPDVTEILSERRTYLRKNVVDGVYENPRHYLDVHFRLLREDFVGPLRDGIQQYLSGAKGKNFDVRVYENVRSLGPRLSPRSGLVYDLFLDPATASKLSWANSRRLMFGNLLVLTFDRFQSCVFVTVEERERIEKDFVISVKTLEKLNNNEQIQIDLDQIDFSYSLTMIETMTYFEAYRPVLNALQLIDPDQTFPLAQFLLQVSNEMVSPDYVTPATAYDFTPLLVEPNSDVTARMIAPDAEPARRDRTRDFVQPVATREFRISYKQSNQVARKYRAVKLLNKEEWPTSDELHLNPKQREALALALTNKVALIQGPPGTGKTFLGVRITEMLLHNRSVWCPSLEQPTPLLMICHTNHALDQFLELIIKRLNLNEGVIRVGNRCQNEVIKPFSLLHARRHVRDTRSIPKHVYHQKHIILDKKHEAEETLKIYEHRFAQSRADIMPLSTFADCYLMSDRHFDSLLAPYDGEMVDTALSEWLGLGHAFEQLSEDSRDIIAIETAMSNMDIKEDDDADKAKMNTAKEEENGDDQEKPQQERTSDDQEPNQQEKNDEKEDEENEEEEEERRRRDELDIDEECLIPSIVTKPQTTQLNPIKKQKVANNDDDDGEGEWQVVIRKAYDRRRLIKYILQYPTTLTDQTVELLNHDLWQLPNTERQNLYRYWLLKYQQYLIHSAREARQEYNQAAAALAEYHQEEDYHILKDAVIVAMTTTCAAKYHTVLEKLQTKIVIVEEAAAIFEAHIITALSTKCEHLILIGDHVQLRPNPSVHHLAMKYRIDVSLFERFVKNNFPNVRLNIQHRMRPEIARLMKHFYDDLEDHESVKTNRPSIRGIDSNVYFINHPNIETTVSDGSSKRNEFEAKYIIALAQYLIKQGYRPEQITVLVMYLGQRQYIAKQTKQIKMLQGVRIMVTDNYQGEENDIVILSLVRSNAEKKIGFLKIHNRICVALSRARCGLFVMGNMNILADAEEMWKKIIKSLMDTKEIGSSLCLSCRQHSKEKFYADKPESFVKRPEGGCNKPCDARLKCGHQCELMCHNYDYEHREIVCHKKCQAPLSCGHLCTKRCHAPKPDQHDPCRVLVEKTVAVCGHKINFQCARTPSVNDCTQPILKRLPCGHPVNVPCSISSSPSALKRFSCPEPCNTILACKHKCVGTCGSCRTGQLHLPCREKCERPLICSHVCKAPCAANCPPCRRPCQTRCTHSQCKSTCGQLCTPCREPCEYKCKHLQCTRLCSEPCNRGPCNEPCEKKLRCGHDCIGICGELCPTQCRICNKHVVQNILFGSEDEPDARFVFLPDCHHIIEVTALDRVVQDSLSRPDENTAIRFPECPQCKQPIRRCQRYLPIINQMNNLIAQVKKKILGNHSEKDIEKQRKQLVLEFDKVQNDLKQVHLEQINNMFAPLFVKDSFLTNDILTLMTNALVFVRKIDQLLNSGSEKLQPNIFGDLVSAPLHHIIRYLSTYCQSRNFAEQQLIDIQAELTRIHRLIYIEALIFSLKGQLSTHRLKPEEKESVDTMQYLVKKTGPFTEEDQVKFDGLVQKIQHLNTLPGLGITEKERISIVSALNMAKGHWYVCSKGHPYVITECGGANQIGQCPECGQNIGGENHQLLPTNRHFGLMDGSQNAAWSNEANLNINPQDL